MNNHSKNILSSFKLIILSGLVFLFPLFFLPTTQEFFTTNKLYLLSFGSLILIVISTIEFLISRRFEWVKKQFDNLVLLFVLGVGLSTLFSSPNKIQAILNPNFGLMMIFSLGILYYYLSRLSSQAFNVIRNSLYASIIVLSLITIFFFFTPLAKTNLPVFLQFLKNPGFTPLGIQLDLLIFLGFFVVHGITKIIIKDNDDNKSALSLLSFIFSLAALSLTIFSIYKSFSTLTLPPFRLSWYAAVEALKNPLTALFGVGIDNFSSIFSKVKDLSYNQSPLWQIQSFSVSRSTILHILTESGVFGLAGIIFVFASLFNLTRGKRSKFVVIYLLVISLFFPPSLALFFLIFVTVAYVASSSHHQVSSFDVSGFAPVYIGLPIISLLIIASCLYLVGRSHLAEYYFKLSLNGIVANNVKELYDNQRNAIITNPYIERFRINFAQTNLLIANNITSNARQQAQKKEGKAENQKIEISAADQQTIAQAIQTAISEGKAAVALNSQKAVNWENLALIYRNILGAVQGPVDAWTTSTYQRSILLDPQNPIYRLNLGGVYYTLGAYNEAVNLFEQAAALKPNWTNAYYNLAWANYYKTDYQKAVLNMQNVLYLLDPKKDQADYKKANSDLEEFKKKLPKTEAEQTVKEPASQQQQLSLPTPGIEKVEPKVILPKEASPEAK